MRDYAKKKVKELGLSGEGKVRVNMAGCLDRCDDGPVIVVYPEEIWYTYLDKSDVDEISASSSPRFRSFVRGLPEPDHALDRLPGAARG